MIDKLAITHCPKQKAVQEQLRPARNNAVSQRSAETRQAISVVHSDDREPNDRESIDVETPMTTSAQTSQSSNALRSLDPETREYQRGVRSAGNSEPLSGPPSLYQRYKKYPADTLDTLPIRSAPSAADLRNSLRKKDSLLMRFALYFFGRK